MEPAAACDGGTLHVGERVLLAGHYTSLAYADGFPWGLDWEMNRICQIKLLQSKPPSARFRSFWTAASNLAILANILSRNNEPRQSRAFGHNPASPLRLLRYPDCH